MWYWDLENPEHEWMSEKFWQTLGYDPKKRQHLASEWQDLINQDDLADAFSNFEKHCAHPNHPYDQVVRYLHSNGSTVWVRCRGKAIRNSDGKPIRMLGAHVDVTVEKEKELELVKTLQSRERFFARISHEIRTPLHGMIGIAENIKRQSSDLLVNNQLQTMLDCGHQLQQLLNDLLTISKIDNDEFTCEKSTVPLEEIISNVYELFSAKANEKSLEFVIPKSNELMLNIETDKTRLIQIISNLVNNAIKFTNEGSVKIEIERDLPNSTASIIVSDSGIGIKNTATVFDAYQQEALSELTTGEGTGLGLEIVSKLCKKMAHQIELTSSEGIGTNVRVTVKLASNNESTRAEPQDTQSTHNSNVWSGENRPARVLIVDDNDINREILLSMLDSDIQCVEQATNGQEALDKTIQSGGYDLILMDLNMPVKNGYEAAKEIRALTDANKANTLIAVTADNDAAARKKCKEHGIEYFLSKPFNRRSLFNTLNEAFS